MPAGFWRVAHGQARMVDQLNSPEASALWARTEPARRQIVPRLLARAVAANAAEK